MYVLGYASNETGQYTVIRLFNKEDNAKLYAQKDAESAYGQNAYLTLWREEENGAPMAENVIGLYSDAYDIDIYDIRDDSSDIDAFGRYWIFWIRDPYD